MLRLRAVQDQRRALQEMCQAAFGDQAPAVDVYDGDTAKVGLLRRCDTPHRGAFRPPTTMRERFAITADLTKPCRMHRCWPQQLQVGLC